MNEDLPSYVVMHARTNHPQQSLFNRLWGTGFMPSDHQGVLLGTAENPILYLKIPRAYPARPSCPTRCTFRTQSESFPGLRSPGGAVQDQTARNGLPDAGIHS